MSFKRDESGRSSIQNGIMDAKSPMSKSRENEEDFMENQKDQTDDRTKQKKKLLRFGLLAFSSLSVLPM